MHEEEKKVATQSPQPASGMQAFKTGLLMAIPRDRHTFGALLKTVLFYGGGWAVLMGLWMVYGPRGAHGSVPLSFHVGGETLSMMTVAMSVMMAFPFIAIFSVRCVLEHRTNVAYFDTRGPCVFMGAFAAGGIMFPLSFVGDLAFARTPQEVQLLTLTLSYVVMAYIAMVIVHLVASGRLALKETWQIFKPSFFMGVLVSGGTILVLAVAALLTYGVLVFMVVGGMTLMSFQIGHDPLMVIQDWATLLRGNGLYRGLLPYDFIILSSLGLLIGLVAWTCAGSFAALASIYSAQKATESSAGESK
ncbi:MAG: hypothetical protein C0514_04295 [Candidatus Puniceispirillum sp.]|nr:hypothetical protein [Candidatus Puniceispirillum sp.]